MSLLLYAIIDNKKVDYEINEFIDKLALDTNVRLQIIRLNNLSALVSSISREKSDVSRNDLLIYAEIVDKISEKYTVLPMRYGSVLDADNDVVIYLKNNESSFTDSLELLYNKEEYAVKLLFSAKKNNAPVKDTFSCQKKSLPAVLQGNTESKKYLLNKYENYTVQEQRDKYIENIKSYFASKIHTIATYVDFKKPLSSTIIIDAVILIEKSKKNELLDIVLKMQALYPEHNIILTGPWPPYNFTKI